MIIQQHLPLIIATSFLLCSSLLLLRDTTSNKQDQEREVYIDGMRGLAAVAVVATHFWRLATQGISYSFDFSFRENYGSLAVQIFFCITGLLFFSQMYSKSGVLDWSRFYTSRFRRLIPAYSAYFILNTLAISLVGDWPAFKSTQIYHLIDMAFLGFKGNGNDLYALGIEIDRFFSVIWTLAYEVKFYLAFPFIVWASFSKLGDKLAISLASALITYEISHTGTTFSGYFMTGAIAAKYLHQLKAGIKTRSACSLVAVVALYFSLTAEFKAYGWERYLLSSALFFSLVVARPRVLTLRPLTIIGDMSYSIYLIHAPILMLIGYALKLILTKQATSDAQFILITFCATALVFIASRLSYKYVESPFLVKKSSTLSVDSSRHNQLPA